MARLPRLCVPGVAQHVIQRGVNRQVCFCTEGDLSAYANWLYESAQKFEVAIHAWVFMTNHVHLLLTPSTSDGVSKMMQTLGRFYVRYFNHTYQRSGTLWEGRFKSCAVEAERYLMECYRYIELNPVRAGMVESPGQYKWSSYNTNGFGKKSKLCTPHHLYTALGNTIDERSYAYRQLFRGHLSPEFLYDIREASNKGLAIGSERFKDEIERLTGRRVRLKKRGPNRGLMHV